MPAQAIKITGARQHKLSGLDAVCVGVLLAYFLHFALPALRAGFGEGSLLKSEEKSRHVIQAFHSVALHPEPGSGILLRPEKRFYQNGYYPLFVASLVWNDHSLWIDVEGEQHLLSLYPPTVGIAEHQVAEISYVVSFSEF